MKSRWPFFLAVLLSLSLLRISPLFAQNQVPDDDVAREGLKFAQIYDLVEQNHADAVDADKAILEGAVRGMLASLDPFSAFFNREQFESLEQQARGEALGFGSILYVQPGKVLVLQTKEGSPSWRAGLGPGDEIVSINGTRVDRIDFNSLIELLRRSRSQPVRLGVIHPGKLVAQDFDLKPAQVDLPTVDKAFALSPGIAYIHVSSFEQKTAQEITDALVRLGGSNFNGLRSLLLDLRDNHGGILDSAVATAAIFLKPDLPVLTIRGRAVPEKGYRAPEAPRHFGGPLIVLVNGNTASAAEVVTAALQEHDRALIVGEPTFGKGVVEGVFPLSEKTAIALTTAEYFTSSGRSIQRPMPGTALAQTSVEPGFSPAQQKDPASDAPARHGVPVQAGRDEPLQAYHTDNGRLVSASGGISPDVEIPGAQLDPWITFLNNRGAFASYASEYLSVHGKVGPSFEPDSKVLNEFREYLTRQGIRAPEEYWSRDLSYLKLRIKTEIFNLVFGLARGNEVETRGDPQAQKAATLFPKIAALLKPPPATIHAKRLPKSM